MADCIINYTGDQINTKLGQIKTQAEISTMITEEINSHNSSKHSISDTVVTNNGFSCYCYKVDRIAFVSIIGGTASAQISTNGIIMTLPDAYRPIQTVEGIETSSYNKRIRILTDGKMELTAGTISTGGYVRISFCYITAS